MTCGVCEAMCNEDERFGVINGILVVTTHVGRRRMRAFKNSSPEWILGEAIFLSQPTQVFFRVAVRMQLALFRVPAYFGSMNQRWVIQQPGRGLRVDTPSCLPDDWKSWLTVGKPGYEHCVWVHIASCCLSGSARVMKLYVSTACSLLVRELVCRTLSGDAPRPPRKGTLQSQSQSRNMKHEPCTTSHSGHRMRP